MGEGLKRAFAAAKASREKRSHSMSDDKVELVERVKFAIKKAEDSQPINPFNFDWRGDAARAAIAIVLEEAAKVAEHTLMREPAGWPLREPTPNEIAAAIRAKR
jgi:hypothetical protein